MTQVYFTDQEINALFQLLDLGVKAGGLPAAGAAFTIQQKLQFAIQEAKNSAPETSPRSAEPDA